MNKQGDDFPDKIQVLDPEQVQVVLTMLQKKDEKINSQEENLKNQEEKIQSLQHQLDWFKRQLFGSTSEKKDFSDHPYQTTLAELFGSLTKTDTPEKEKQIITYQRGKAKKNPLEGSPDGSLLRFDESVPVEEIQVKTPELEGEEKDDYEVIGEKVI